MIEVRISYKVKRDLEEAKFASKCNFQENWFDIDNRWVSSQYLLLLKTIKACTYQITFFLSTFNN